LVNGRFSGSHLGGAHSRHSIYHVFFLWKLKATRGCAPGRVAKIPKIINEDAFVVYC
jgi:hypothetical protein